MQFDFKSAIDQLNQNMPFGDTFAFRNSRTRLVPGEYLFNTILPQREKPNYNVTGGSMRIYPTMSQLTPMDTPPKPIGAMETSLFNENTAKWGGEMHFPEARLRELQEFATQLAAQGLSDGLGIGAINAQTAKQVTDTLLGFADLLLKSQWDTFEWLRGQALTTGGIALSNSGLDLTVDYDIPSGNKLTASGANAYFSTTSKWWTHLRAASTKLSQFKIMMNSNTYYSIIDNPVNNIRVVDGSGDSRSIIRFVGTNETNSTDQRDRVNIILYDKSGSGITPKGTMKALPFLPDGKVVLVGMLAPDGFELLQGSTEDPNLGLELGYTHIAPTVEGGRPGIWSRIFTPEGKPYQLLGETFANALPVIANPKKVMILTTDMPS